MKHSWKFSRLTMWLSFYLCCHFGVANAAISATVSTEIPINFGTYNPLSPTDLVTVGRIAVGCSGGAISYSIELNPGNNGSFLTRKMHNRNTYLNYNLYTDPAKTKVWGDGTQGSTLITGGGNCYSASAFQNIVYGRIPALQKNVLAGSYTDLVIITLNY